SRLRPRSPGDAPAGRALPRTLPRAHTRARGRLQSLGGSSLVTQGSEEVVGAEVLKRLEAGARRADVRDLRVERRHSLPQAEVTGRPSLRPGEVTRQEPVRTPFADPAQRGKPLLDLLVGQVLELGEVEIGTRDSKDVLGLTTREADCRQLVVGCGGDAVTHGKRDRTHGGDAEPIDETAADGEGRLKRDL